MNDYSRLIAKAAAKFTGKPAILSPLLDDHGWENKKSLLSSEPSEFRLLWNVDSFLMKEVVIVCKDGKLEVHMQHCSRNLGEKNYRWSRNCKYIYNIHPDLINKLTACWTNDQFMIIQPRRSEFSLIDEKYEEFRLLPINIINVLQPALNVPLLKHLLKVVQDKSSHICYYVEDVDVIPQDMDSLSLLKSVPLLNDEE